MGEENQAGKDVRHPLRILIVDDYPDDRILVKRALKQEFPNLEAKEIIDAKGFSEAIQAGCFDAVITDYHLHWGNGMDILNTVKTRFSDCPVIMLTGTGSQMIAVEAMKAGLDDYVIKQAESFERVPLALKLSLNRLWERRKRKQAETLLIESEKNYRLLVNNIPCIVYKRYPDWSVEFFDDKVEMLTGYGSEEFNCGRKKWCDVIDKEDIETAERSFLSARKTDGSLISEYRIKSASGDIYWIQDRGQIVFDDKGAAEYITGVFFDITYLKMAEHEKKKLEAQLRQAQKMEAIGTLTGGIAHDFNNLLTTIIGYSEIALEDSIQDTNLYDTIKEVVRAGQRAALLTRQLLAFSRKQMIQPEILNINDISKDTEKMLRRMIGEDIDMVSEFSPELWDVKVDPGQIEQVLMNLAVNARDAMPRGGKLTIETANVNLEEDYFQDHEVELRPGSYVMLAVTDSGIGMDEETQNRIFEPFFTSKEMGRGTGLGLSTVYGIIKQNKGHIWVYSEPGEGTTFKVYLPAIMAETDAVKKEAKTSEDRFKGTETVLLVEDDDMLRKTAQKIFETQGYTVLSARNSDEAFKISNEYHSVIHLLLTDLVMPGMNGKEMSKQIESRRPEIKVLYMSGYTDNAIAHRGVLDNDINFIQKPFSPSDLACKAREVLDQGIDDCRSKA